jgi:hypothetical protein
MVWRKQLMTDLGASDSYRRPSAGVAYCRGSAFGGRLLVKSFNLQ